MYRKFIYDTHFTDITCKKVIVVLTDTNLCMFRADLIHFLYIKHIILDIKLILLLVVMDGP